MHKSQKYHIEYLSPLSYDNYGHTAQ